MIAHTQTRTHTDRHTQHTYTHLFNLVVHDLELALHLGNLVLRLDEVLAVQVAIRAYGFVQVLLLLQFGLQLGDLPLHLFDCAFLQLGLLQLLLIFPLKTATTTTTTTTTAIHTSRSVFGVIHAK